MSEYQYYEFQAIDHPLGEADRQALRNLSTRARITTTSFTNSYEWGDFKGDPVKLMARWFDLHLYLANWGTRRLMIRLPKRLIDRRLIDRVVSNVECATLLVAGENLILDITRDEIEPGEDWDDGSGWLAALAPLRADVVAGDLRLFYLLWLTEVEADAFEAGEREPMPGIGPMTGALEAFAEFFGIDPYLVQAAAERSADAASPDAARKAVAAMTDREKTEWLVRLFDGDPHVAGELRAVVRKRLGSNAGAPPVAARTVRELRARARAIRLAGERVQAEQAAAERKRRADEAEKARRARLDAIKRRGESVWREIETEIERRNASGYDNAVGLLTDLRTIAEEQGTMEDFAHRLRTLRERHVRKERFIERSAAIR
ncbi:MAG: hypothetical protein ACLQUZ_09560 [Rhizomicrobium sp.]